MKRKALNHILKVICINLMFDLKMGDRSSSYIHQNFAFVPKFYKFKNGTFSENVLNSKSVRLFQP
jgi:hypothetical protein